MIRNIEYIIESYQLTYSRTKEKGFYIEYKHEGLSNYNREGYIYGFDWLSSEDARRRKQLIEKDPLSFLYFNMKK